MIDLEKQIEAQQRGGYELTQEPDINNIFASDPIFWKLVDDHYTGNNAFLVGPAGTGKTTLAKGVAFFLGIGEVTINCSQWTSPTEIQGGETIEGYKVGKLFKAFGYAKDGQSNEGRILILDELPKLDPNTAGLFNDALAQTAKSDGKLEMPNGEVVYKAPRFGVIAAGNTTGKELSEQYGGNNVQDASLLDRFSGSYYYVGFDEAKERKLTFAKVFAICKHIRDMIMDAGSEEIMTLRTMLNFNRTYDLEMRRLLGQIEKNPMGKTLENSIESYFSVMTDQSLAEKILLSEDYQKFLNHYRDLKFYRKDLKRFGNGN